MSDSPSSPPSSTALSDHPRGPASRMIPMTTFAGTRPPEEGPRALDVRGVSVSFGKRSVLHDVSFHVPVGEFLCLSGPNGAGKSTLLKCILGLLEPTRGRIVIGGLPVNEGRRKVGYVPQRKAFDRDFPATPLDVIVANLRGRWPLFVSKTEREAAMAALERCGAGKLANRQMSDLSGGEAQRVFLARALATKPELLILDEPPAGVDVGGRAAIVDLMAEISASETMAAVLVTHNLQAIARCAERVIYLERTVRAWGLWSELSSVDDLSAIRTSDPNVMSLDGD